MRPRPTVSPECLDDPLFPDITVQLTGESANAFTILTKVDRALKQAGHRSAAESFMREAMSGGYDHLLQTCMGYVNVE